MIDKTALNKSIKFFDDIELKNEDISLIFDKFEKLLNNPEIKSLIKKKMSFLKNVDEDRDIREIMHDMIVESNLDDLNKLLENLIKEESLTNWLQDFFLEKLI
jgi:hypothetical protein